MAATCRLSQLRFGVFGGLEVGVDDGVGDGCRRVGAEWSGRRSGLLRIVAVGMFAAEVGVCLAVHPKVALV